MVRAYPLKIFVLLEKNEMKKKSSQFKAHKRTFPVHTGVRVAL